MRFLVDAQLPRRAAGWLVNAGCDAIHTLDLPDGNRTTDQQVIDLADRGGRAVVTKDADFVELSPPSIPAGKAAADLDREHRQPGPGSPDGAADRGHPPRVPDARLPRAGAVRSRRARVVVESVSPAWASRRNAPWRQDHGPTAPGRPEAGAIAEEASREQEFRQPSPRPVGPPEQVEPRPGIPVQGNARSMRQDRFAKNRTGRGGGGSGSR